MRLKGRYTEAERAQIEAQDAADQERWARNWRRRIAEREATMTAAEREQAAEAKRKREEAWRRADRKRLREINARLAARAQPRLI